MKHNLRQLMHRFVFFAILLLLASCAKTNDSEPPPNSPIFAGTTAITLKSPAHAATINTSNNFNYELPAEVTYAVIGIFNANVVTSDSTISNEANFLYGSRTGMSDFVRGFQTQATLHGYDSATKNFKSPNSSPAASSGTYYWAVWGYDQFGNLTHSSPAWRFVL